MQKRWNFTQMLETGRRLFTKVHKRKHAANHNSEIHFLAREINDWLPAGVQSLIDGNYWPRHLQRYHFSDETVDQLHVSDRILQHILLQQLKPTFAHVRKILQERCLTLSRRKTRIGSIQDSFHFLGIQYLGTQPLSNITVSHSANDAIMKSNSPAAILATWGGGDHWMVSRVRLLASCHTHGR